jgi:two-component system, LytTR family, response regulator
MPGLDGFEVLERAAADRMPVVLFVTAYDRFAIRAFEVHAVDYLLKPFTAERMRQALAHVRRELERDEAAALREGTAALLDARAGHGGVPNAERGAAGGGGAPFAHRLTVRDGEAFVMLRTDEIDWVEAAANYVRVHARGRIFVVRVTMQALEKRLDPRQFARIQHPPLDDRERGPGARDPAGVARRLRRRAGGRAHAQARAQLPGLAAGAVSGGGAAGQRCGPFARYRR